MQAFRDGQEVDGLRLAEEVLDGLVDLPVGLLVKGCRLKNVDDGIHRGLLEHAGPQHSFLQLDGLRRLLSDTGETRVDGGCLARFFALSIQGFVVGHGVQG